MRDFILFYYNHTVQDRTMENFQNKTKWWAHTRPPGIQTRSFSFTIPALATGHELNVPIGHREGTETSRGHAPSRYQRNKTASRILLCFSTHADTGGGGGASVTGSEARDKKERKDSQCGNVETKPENKRRVTLLCVPFQVKNSIASD